MKIIRIEKESVRVMKKTLNIIPHSHWDREWYMGFERHRFRLVELFDALIDVMEKNPDFTYYHMDGQFIVVEDYLEIRPEMRERLLALIRADRIQIGPWYVLQDEYLTSGEANVRNMLYGIRLCRSIGASPVMSGYFPDAFGNVSQVPQILRGFGIDNAIFGRGLNDIGSNNEVVKQNGITKSELLWRAPDGSEVIGIMFANWYHNAMELPTDREALADRIRGIAASTARFSETDQLLGMNGCDHQPLQRNLHEVIKLANEVQDEVYVKQSNFKEYVDKIRGITDRLAPVEGEIAGQLTSGNGLLINTASAHIDIKQQNQYAQNLLSRIAEPINSISCIFGDEYRSDFFLYAWRKLMQNHPHDSICTCSDDDVYTEMLTRFRKSVQTADELRLAGLDYIAANMSGGGENKLAVLSLDPGRNICRVRVNVDFPLDAGIKGFTLTDEEGKCVPVSYKHIGRTFTYTLPKDRFRQPRYIDRFETELMLETNGIGIRLLTINPSEASVEPPKYSAVSFGARFAENEFIRLDFADDGSFNLIDKRNGRIYPKQNIFEDVRDCGNLYNFVQPGDSEPVTSEGRPAEICVSAETPYSVTFRVAARLDADIDIVSYVSIYDRIPRVEIRTELDNRAENHRLRALFGGGIVSDTVLAEGQFDLVRRNIVPWEGWTNPSNTQRCDNFFALEGDNGALLVSGRGLNEYEILRDGKNTMALTLLRAVGEIGDWGVFPTPLGQCIGSFALEYAIVPYETSASGDAYALAYEFTSSPLQAVRCTGEGSIEAGNIISADNPYIRMSALKKCEDRNSLIFRVFNISDEEQSFELSCSEKLGRLHAVDLSESRLYSIDERRLTIGKKKIATFELELK